MEQELNKNHLEFKEPVYLKDGTYTGKWCFDEVFLDDLGRPLKVSLYTQQETKVEVHMLNNKALIKVL